MIASQAILGMVDYLEAQQVCLHGFEVRRHGRVCAESYYAPFAPGQMHRMYSVSKTVTALALGVLLGDGRLSLEDRISSFFPDKLPERPDGRLMRLTLRDMLRMATCYPRTTYREGVDEDWAATFFVAKATHEPGTLFNYDTSCSQVLCALCQRLAGEDMLSFLERRVFRPIGATGEKAWLRDPSGVPQGGTGLMMTLRDLGFVAQLVADGGRGLIPADYIAAMTRRQIVNDRPSIPEEAHGYGYQMWMTRDGWAMCGMGGQMAIYSPGTDTLLCTIGDTRLDPYGIQKIYNAFYDVLLPHADDPEVPGSAALLEKRLRSLETLHVRSVGPTWSQERRVYAMEDNPQGLERVALGDRSVTLVWSQGTHAFRWQTDGAGEVTRWPGSEEPALLSAGTNEDGALQLRCQLIGRAPCGVQLLLHEKNGTLTLRMSKSNDPLTAGYEGIFWGSLLSSERGSLSEPLPKRE